MTFHPFFQFVLLAFLALGSCSQDPNGNTTTDDETNSTNCDLVASTFKINLTTTGCTVDLPMASIYNETVDANADTRTMTFNGIPGHLVGTFPNNGNPNTISEQGDTYVVDLTPQISNQMVSAQGYEFGVLFSGVVVDPFTAEFFMGSGGINMNWNITTLTSTVNLGLDCNNAHVQPTGKYHYHGTPSAYVSDLGIDGTEMVKVGYAADGFPIYYKYGYDASGSSIIELTSGYRLIDGSRPGDGISAPDGCYDGTYFQDYEYVDGLSLLDACNGRFGKTPESNNEYYYVITDNFPSSPLCFSGTPSNDFRF
ncbi:MAG TPA: YHYH protein [Flavobacteriaceae bacterium]|nr:YHYH protein [Flavobacteriaceae bacterium]MCB9212152.1 YHYH protein [Alteromonas sp.]HPF10469.1 YHYH protein [Flavobacteriaceae bacterium]HQU21778.1 YHYH protein [Flavobacteriaceae bacterium]HQU64680.1 YHYH protein [Flavobacteriaceae bacterium]